MSVFGQNLQNADQHYRNLVIEDSLLTRKLTALQAQIGTINSGSSSVKSPACICVATTPLPSCVYSNLDLTLSATSVGALTIDGVTVTFTQSVLVNGQVSPSQNGIYVVTTPGTADQAFLLTRRRDFDEPGNMLAGDSVYVLDGTVYSDTQWVLPTSVAIVGISPVGPLIQPSSLSAIPIGANLTKANGVLDVVSQPVFASVRLTNGAASNYILTSDALGNASWVAPTSSSGVSFLSGTTNQVNVSANTGAVTLSLPQNIAVTSSPQFASIRLTTGAAAGSILMSDLNGQASWNALQGTTNQVNINVNSSTVTLSLPQNINVGATPQFASVRLTTGAMPNFILKSDVDGNSSWVALSTLGVSSVQGTTDQVNVSGNTGAVILSLPQSIATNSTVQFAKVGVGMAAINALDVAGKTSTTTFQMTNSPTAGFVLTSDSSGNGTWTAIPASGVTFLNGTTDQVLVSANVGAVTLSLPQSIATTSTVQFAKLGLGTAATANTLEVSGKTATTTFQMTSSPTAGFVLTSDSSGNGSWAAIPASGVTSIGGTTNQVLVSASIGAVVLSLPQSIATTSSVQFGKLGLNTAPTTNELEVSGKIATTAFQLKTNPTAGFVLTSDSTGNGSWTAIPAAGVTSINGTTNQVLVSANVGAVTLSLPQSIATTSTVQFGGMVVTGYNTPSVGPGLYLGFTSDHGTINAINPGDTNKQLYICDNGQLCYFGGQVGIGQTSPLAGTALDVKGSINVDINSLIGQLSSDGGYTVSVVSGASASTRSGMAVRDSWNGVDNNNAYVSLFVADGAQKVESLRAIYNATAAASYIGIGTANPLTMLQVGASSRGFYNDAYSTNPVCINKTFNANWGTVGSEQQQANLYLSSTQNDTYDIMGAIGFGGKNYGFSDYSVMFARIGGQYLGNFYGGLVFQTMHNMNDGKLYSDMYIQNGNVGIGKVPACTLDVNGSIGVYNTGTTFTAAGTLSNALDLYSNLGTYRIGFDNVTGNRGYIRHNIIKGEVTNVWGHVFSTSLDTNETTRNTFSDTLFVGGSNCVGVGTVTPISVLETSINVLDQTLGSTKNLVLENRSNFAFNEGLNQGTNVVFQYNTIGDGLGAPLPMSSVDSRKAENANTYRANLIFMNRTGDALGNDGGLVEGMRLTWDRALHVGEYSGNPASARIAAMGSYAVQSLGQNRILTLYNAQSGQCWPQVVDLTVGRYSNAANTNPYTRLDINLKNAAGASNVGDVTVMTMLSSGSVGVGADPTGTTNLVQVGANQVFSGTRLNLVGYVNEATGTVNDANLEIGDNGGGVFLRFKRNSSNNFNIDYTGTSTLSIAGNSGGNLGLGQLTPTEKFDILSTVDNVVVAQRIRSTGANGGAKLYLDSNHNGAGDISTNMIAFYRGGTFRAGIGVPSATLSPNALMFNLGSSTVSDVKMTITTGGSVGVGTMTPGCLWEVQGALVKGGGNLRLGALYSTDTLNTGVGAGLVLGGNYLTNTVTEFAQIAGVKENASSGDYNGALVLSTRNTTTTNLEERMRITSVGNVGFNTSPLSRAYPTAGVHNLSVASTTNNRCTLVVSSSDERVQMGAYYEASVDQYAYIQASSAAETAGNVLKLNPLSGSVVIGPSGLMFMNDNVVDYVASTINYYEQWNGQITFTGPFTAENVNVRVTRLGRVTTIWVRQFQITPVATANASAITASSAIPYRFFSTTFGGSQYLGAPCSLIVNNVSTVGLFQVVSLGDSTGIMSFQPYSGMFNATTVCGLLTSMSFTFTA